MSKSAVDSRQSTVIDVAQFSACVEGTTPLSILTIEQLSNLAVGQPRTLVASHSTT